MEFSKIKYSVTEGIASIVLDTPRSLNAITSPLLDDLMAALDICTADENVKAVVISGEGDSFSAGGDIRMMRQGLEGDRSELNDTARKVGLAALRIRNIRKPVIAAVKGATAGAGVNLALACDFRIAADNTKLIQAFVNIGLIPDTGGTFLLTRMLGAARATELIMTGRPVAAPEALELGIVNQVVPLADLEKTALAMAQKFAQGPSLALGNMKALVNRAAFQGFENFLENETEYQIQCSQTEDFQEGIKAFTERRKPNFRGK